LLLGKQNTPRWNRVENVSEQRAEAGVPNAVELLDNVDDDLDRIELWTAALSCFQHPAPEYPLDNVGSDEQGASVPKPPNEAGDRTADVVGKLKGAEDEFYGRTKDNASQLIWPSRSLSRERKRTAEGKVRVARNIAPTLRDAVRNTIETQPCTAVAIALGLGWLLGRMGRSL
jgi:hypothetical protein